VTDERVPDGDKKFFTFPLSIHGIERAGAEAGVRAAEDLATWAACEDGSAPAIVNCAQEGAIPHPILETQPDDSLTGGDALARSAIYFVFANPDGWRRGDNDNVVRFYQRYNGNGVDMNRDWPTVGYTFEGYTPWSEPETRSFGKVLDQIRDRWDGGIDLHGQLIDRAFSFTMIGASERNFSKNQRVLQTVKGAWQDAETRLAWHPQIKPNDAAPQPDDPRMYGVQWGTVWDTIGYTTTGSFGDWIDSPLGLDADGIDNEMSFSHVINCGVGSCYLGDYEQLHIDGNKSLIYAMVNFTLQPEETTFSVPGKVGYVFNPKRLVNDGELLTPPPTEGLSPQENILDVRLDPTNDFKYAFEVKGPDDGVYNGGLEGKATHVNVQGVSAGALTTLILEQFRPTEETPQEDAGCGNGDDKWGTVNTYYDQSVLYLQAGQAVHTNMPLPGVYRICVRGELTTSGARDKATAGSVDLDITFTTEKAWENPGQLPYDVTNMKFFQDLANNMAPGQLVPVNVDAILSGSVDLDQFTSLVVADDPFPGFSEPIAEGPAQGPIVHEPPTAAAATAPCAWPTPQVSLADPPPGCAAHYEFDIDPAFNNQQVFVQLDSPESVENDWDLYLQRQSRVTGDWFTVASSTSGTGDELIQVISPPVGHYRARIVNWAGTVPPSKLEIRFSNEYAGPPIEPSQRTIAERDAWGAKLRDFVEAGGNLVLTDGAVKNVAYMGALPRTVVNTFGVYAGFIALTRDGQTSTYSDPLAQNLNQPGAAEGPGFRHQTYEPVPLGFNIGNDLIDVNSAPAWGVDQIEWEKAGGRTVGITTADQVTLGELELGDGVVRLVGALLPMPTERYYHPFGLANYALTYSGYQVLNNTLQWTRPLPDLALQPSDISFSSDKIVGGDRVTITATVRNIGTARAQNVGVRFTLNGAQLGTVQSIASIPAGSTGNASVVWDTKHLKGDYTIGVTADPGNAIAELSETNNSASRVATVRGNKVKNGSFEQSSNGSSPDNWSSSGETSYAYGGTDGERSVTAGLSGMWLSDAIAVSAGKTYGLAVDGFGGSVSLQQLSSTGKVLSTVTVLTGQAVTIAKGVTQVRVRLAGGLGLATFDNVRLWEE
jgi:hypothetical protein